MIKASKIVCLALSIALLAGISSRHAQADPIDGAIQFFGAADASGSSVGPPVTIHFINPWHSLAGIADYSAIPFGTPTMFTDFTFIGDGTAVTLLSPVTLWSFTFGGLNYSFDLLSLSNGHTADGSMSFTGEGIAHITGRADTEGSFSLQGAGNHLEFELSSSTTSTVPEGTTTALLFLGTTVMAGRSLCKRDSEGSTND